MLPIHVKLCHVCTINSYGSRDGYSHFIFMSFRMPLFFVTVEKIMFMWTRKTIAAHFDVQGRNFNSVKVCSFLWPALHCITMSVRVFCTCAEFCLLSKNKSDCCTLHLLAVCLPHTYCTTLHYHTEGKRTHQRCTFCLHFPMPHLLRLDYRSSPRTPSKQVCTESQLTAVAHEHSFISIE